MRNNLMMHFHCAECGDILDIALNEERSTLKNEFVSGEPTGAACYHVPRISVKPCKRCIEKYTAPAEAMVRAVKAMQDIE